MLDIEVLRIIWWLLLGVLFMGFAITDGFDFGAAILLPFVARNDMQRRIVLNTIGPFWEGNQVWIILGAGAIFAAWPYVYAASFSGFYLLALLLLLTMGISRPVSFKYRSKMPNETWRRFWDHMVFVGGFFPAMIFGIMLGNVMIGLPYSLDNEMRIAYTGTFFQLFTPFTLWCGLTSLWMLTMHGGLYLAIKTGDPIRKRAIRCSRFAAILLILFFAGAGVWIAIHVKGYLVVSHLNHLGYSNPLHKDVVMRTGAWLYNYAEFPYLMIAPLMGLVGAMFAFAAADYGNSRFAFIASSVSMIGIIATVGFSLFPFILPSSAVPNNSLLVWDASSSRLTLFMMLIGVLVFIPLILMYTSWVYYALRGKVTAETVTSDKQAY